MGKILALCITIGDISEDNIIGIIPFCSKILNPIPSLLEHKTDSLPFSETYTLLSVNTPSKSHIKNLYSLKSKRDVYLNIIYKNILVENS